MLKQVPRAAGTACFYLNAVSPEGQELFWRCDPPARRPPYRTSRILARHQLVAKIQQECQFPKWMWSYMQKNVMLKKNPDDNSHFVDSLQKGV
ncbi:stAR-related lipid transfer protein 13-like protein [Turdus rufiventris]|nr:stAR-related lipid transfer protein 13-like protein [Turdus rufiventris]